MPKCELCGRDFKSMAALGSHRAYVHKAGGGADTAGVESDSEILDLKKEVRKGELSLRLQRLKEGMGGDKGNLLFLELDRLGGEIESLKKENEALRSIMATKESLGLVEFLATTNAKMFGDVIRQVAELNKFVGQSLVLEGWRLNTNSIGCYDLGGLGDQRRRWLVEKGKIVITH